MKIPMLSSKIAGRSVAAAACVLAAGLVGCNQDALLTVPTPDIVLPANVSSAAALPNAYAASLGDFQVAFSGSGSYEGLVTYSGMLGDELMNAETFTTRLEVDRRAINVINSSLLPIFQNAERARATAELVASRYVSFDNANPRHAEVLALGAYMYVVMGEDYCNGVPQSHIAEDGTFVYGDPQTDAQLFTAAVAKFDSAITIATAAGANGSTALNLALVGKARALLDLNQPAAAAAAAALVTTDKYVYNILHDENTSREYNGLFVFTVNSKRFTVANNEGGNGLPFVTLNDPRAPVVRTTVGFDGATPFYRSVKYTSLSPAAYGYLGTTGRGAPVTLASGVEARLIEAENALRNNDDVTLLAKLNAARAAAKTYSDQPTAPASPAPLTVADLGLTTTSRQNLLFQERALDMYLTNHRLGDMRRLIRQYGRDQSTVFPVGAYNPLGAAAGSAYGTDVNLPVPFEEQNNPKYKGCIDRNA